MSFLRLMYEVSHPSTWSLTLNQLCDCCKAFSVTKTLKPTVHKRKATVKHRTLVANYLWCITVWPPHREPEFLSFQIVLAISHIAKFWNQTLNINPIKITRQRKGQQNSNGLPMLCWRPRSSGINRAARGGTSCGSRVGCFFSCTNTGAWSEPSSFTFLPPTHLCQVFQSKRSTTEGMKMKSIVDIIFTHLRWKINMHPKFLSKWNLFQTYPWGHNP